MTYKLYLTIEMPESFEDLNKAMDAAVDLLRDHVEDWAATPGDRIARPIKVGVIEEGKVLHGGKPEFTIDICDGAI